jgi:hypothetical protein
MYHVGRPGHDGYMDRVLQSWGVDGHNSHTNVCSGAARLGYALWTGATGPSPDYENAKFIAAALERTSRPATTSTRTRSASSTAR